jgi:hypothetical protein
MLHLLSSCEATDGVVRPDLDHFAVREGVVAGRLSVFGLGATPQSEVDHLNK